MMVNNSAIFYKLNNQLSSQIIEHKKTASYIIGIQGSDLGQAQSGRVKPLNGIPTFPLLISGSPMAIQIHVYKHAIKKPAQIHFHSKRPYTITRMNNNINIDSTIAGSINACRLIEGICIKTRGPNVQKKVFYVFVPGAFILFICF